MEIVNPVKVGKKYFPSVVGGPIALSAWRVSSGFGIGFFVGFYGTFVAIQVGLILLFAAAGKIDPKFNKILRSFAAAALLVFGMYQLWLGTMAVIRFG